MPESPTRAEFQAFAEKILPDIDKLTPNQQHKLFLELTRLRKLDTLQDAKDHLIPFMAYMWPRFVQSWHHVVIANCLEKMEQGEILRSAISTPPRYTKSEMLSKYFPAWVLGRNPTEDTKIIQAGNTAKLSQNFGRQCKNIIQTEEYRELFPDTIISPDSKAGGNFATTEGALYYACGVGGALAGRGASYLLCDDIFSEQDILSGNAAQMFDDAEEWYMTAIQRLQPGGRACVLHTRWSKIDLIGRLIERMHKNPRAEQYQVISIPALDENDQSTFPAFWKTEEVLQKRETLMERTSFMWFAQYMQNPTADSMAIIKREWWKKHERTNLRGERLSPPCKFTLMVFDTAYTDNKRSNPSAITVWGVFDAGELPHQQNNICLLHSYQKKMELPELKTQALSLVRQWEPDCVLVEGKSSGPWVLEEFRRANIMAQSVIPKPGEDKMSRLNSVSDIFASGRVWYIPTAANEETVQQCADFPAGIGDDLVDTTAYALRRLRQGGFVTTKHDHIDEPRDPTPVDRAYY